MTEESLFQEALSRSPEERAAFLAQACADRPELRAAVEALLAAHEKSGNVLDRPQAEPEPVATTAYDPQAAPGAVIAGRYTLVEKIGEGGMGEVWVAKQTDPVKRRVALKLIKAGMDSRAVLQRFEQERQALALMDHPNIARVLDGGLTADRRPFFVMELVNGLPLTRFCDEAKLGIRERLELFTAVCHAVQHAHQKGVVHRDLKPANILVTIIDGRGVPKVIDFGVAKAIAGRLTDESLSTQFGAVVGTLEYMSPEQAGFAGQDVDTRADIYSLGVILYELLTGLRPIDAKRLHKAAFAEMIRIIQEEEPSKPSARLSTDALAPSLAALRQTEPRKLATLLRGELDWVVMRCLEKRRDRRYETANGLARDLQRYLADEPVEARPPSAGYRLGKFLKRHRGPVVAASLVLLALVVGIAGTTWGLIEAHDKEKAAVASRNDAVEARNDLAAKNTELEQSQDQLEGALARTWLSPLAEAPGFLTDGEIGAFTDLAAFRNKPLADRFVTEALSNRQGMRKLRAHSAFALHAVVGLDARKRQEVEQRLVRALESPDLTDEARIDLAFTALALEGLSPATAVVLAQTWIPALPKTNDPSALRELASGLSSVAGRLESREVAEAAAALTQAMTTTHDANALQSLAESLSAVAGRLEPREAARVCAQAAATLTQALTEANDFRAGYPLARGLSAVAPRLVSREAAEAAGTLIQAMTKTKDGIALSFLAQGLSAVAGRLESREVAEAAATFTQAMTTTNDDYALLLLARGLSAVVGRLEPREAARVCAQAAATLTQALTKPNPGVPQYLAEGLSVVAGRLEPKEAAATLTQALTKTNYADALRVLAEGLSAVANRLEPKEAAAALTLAMTETSSVYALQPLAEGLSAVAGRLEPKAAAQVCAQAAATLTQAMPNKTNAADLLGYLVRGLSAVAGRLEPKEAAKAAAALTQAMTTTNNASALHVLTEGLSAVAGRMEPKEAARVCAQAAATLSQAMTKTNAFYDLDSLAQALSAVAGRLEPKEAARVCAQAAAKLIQAMTETNNAEAFQYLARGLTTVAARLEPREAAQVCAQAAATLTQAMTKTKDAYPLSQLAEGLSAVAPRLEPREAAAALTLAMTKTNNNRVLSLLAESVSAVAARLEPREASRVCAQAAATLTQAMTKTSQYASDDGPSLARGLSAVAGRLEPRDATEAAATITQAMTKNNDPKALRILAQGLSAVAGRLEPREAAAALTQAMTKTNDANLLHDLAEGRSERGHAPTARVPVAAFALPPLAEGLSAVAARLEPREAAQVSAQAAATLTQAMTKTNDWRALRLLTEGLSAVAPRLEAGEAARVCAQAAATLTQAMTKTNVFDDGPSPTQSLSAVLGDGRRLERAQAVSAAVGSVHDSQGLLGALALLQPAAEPFPRRLSDQELVELLKQPLCVGPARRAILDHLELQYQRLFADQWEFVRFAEEKKLGLDFTSPPKRR